MPTRTDWLTVSRKVTLILTDPRVYQALSQMIHVYIQQNRKRVVFSESCNAVSPQWIVVWTLNLKINEDKTQAIYFSHRPRPVEAHLTLKERRIPFVNNVKYLGAIVNKKLHGEYILKRSLPRSFKTLLAFISFWKVHNSLCMPRLGICGG